MDLTTIIEGEGEGGSQHLCVWDTRCALASPGGSTVSVLAFVYVVPSSILADRGRLFL